MDLRKNIAEDPKSPTWMWGMFTIILFCSLHGQKLSEMLINTRDVEVEFF